MGTTHRFRGMVCLERRFPEDSPRGKGGRLEARSSVVDRVTVNLPNVVAGYMCLLARSNADKPPGPAGVPRPGPTQ